MAKLNKPSSRLIWGSDAVPGDVLDPGDVKFKDGWISEIPPFEYFNFIHQLFSSFIQYINQEGIPEWDAATTYFTGSYTRSGAILYRSLIDDNINFAVTDVSRWAVAFLVPSNNLSDLPNKLTSRTNLSVYSKAETDAAYTKKSNNLSDVASISGARTNLSVYSKSESDNLYTKKSNNLSDVASISGARTNLSVYSKAEVYTKTESNITYVDFITGTPASISGWDVTTRNAYTETNNITTASAITKLRNHTSLIILDATGSASAIDEFFIPAANLPTDMWTALDTSGIYVYSQVKDDGLNEFPAIASVIANKSANRLEIRFVSNVPNNSADRTTLYLMINEFI